MKQNGKTDRHQRNKFNVQLCFSIIILISKMNLNRTERNGKTDRHQRKKFNVHVCFSIIIFISKMNFNGTEWNWTEKLIDITGINSMLKCVSLSSWSTKSISTERNRMEKLIDVYVRISRIFCVSVSELLNPLQYPSIKFGSGTVLEQKNWILNGLGTEKSIFLVCFYFDDCQWEKWINSIKTALFFSCLVNP